MLNIIVFYISIGLFVSTVVASVVYLFYSRKKEVKQNNSLKINKKEVSELLLKKITNNKIKIIVCYFFSPRMGSNKIYYDKDNSFGFLSYVKNKLSLKNLNEILKEKLFFRLSKYKSESKRIWDIAKATEEVIGSTYVFTKKRAMIFLFNQITFLLAAFGALWPIALGFTINYGVEAILNNKLTNNGNLFISSLLLLSSMVAGILSIMIRQVYVYWQFLKISDKIELPQEETKKIKKIIFSKIFFSLGMIILLPLDFIREFSQSWLFHLLLSPFIGIWCLVCMLSFLTNFF